MADARLELREVVDNAAVAERLLEQRLADHELAIPSLPDVAVRIIRSGTQVSANAQHLADIIHVDPGLTAAVLRIAASAANRPVTPIASLQHAVAWLGFDEVANIAFTLALQGRMLDVPGHKDEARRLWRHALASALWSRHLAQLLSMDTGLCYLCGLLHNIGKVVALGAVNELARLGSLTLTGTEFDRVIETFHRPIGTQVVSTWRLPSPVLLVTLCWETYGAMKTARLEANIVHVAHRLADILLFDRNPGARDRLVTDPAYRELGLRGGNAVFDSATEIDAELDRYLAR